MQVNYYINGIEIEQPINAAELSVSLNNDLDDVNSQTSSITEVEFGIGDNTSPNDASNLIHAHKNSSQGVFVGLPYKVELTQDGNTYVLFDGYLDTSKALWDCDRVIVNAVEKANVDWLNDVATNASYAYMYETGVFNNSEFIPIPYVNSELPNNKEAFMAAVSLFLISETLTNQLQSLIEYVSGIVTLGWTDIIKIILRVIYLAGLLVIIFQ